MEKPSTFSQVKKRVRIGKAKGQRSPWREMLNSVSAFRAMEYGYSNARVKAMKSLLLKKDFLLELCRMRSVPEVVERLERTYYKETLEKNSMHYHGSDLVQIACMLRFAELVGKVNAMVPESDRAAFDIMLTKWEIANAKTVLSARRTGRKYGEVAPFIIPIGTLGEEDIKDILAGSGGSETFMRFIRTDLGRRIAENKVISSAELEKLFTGGLSTGDAIRVETVLDILYYKMYANAEKAAGKEFGPISKIFKREIDLKNASMVARLKKHGITDPKVVKSYLIKNGSKGVDFYDRIIEAKDDETLKMLAELFDLKDVPASVADLELQLNQRLAREKLRAFYRSVLSIGAIFGFLLLLEEEQNNLRKIVIGKEFAVPDEKIAGMLVFPN